MYRFKIAIVLLFQTLMMLPVSAGMTIWDDRPADKWVEAYPVGNGFMGAMMYGTPSCEHIQFNEESLCTGSTKTMGSYQPFGDLFIEQDIDGYTDYRRELSLDDAVCRVSFTANGVKYHREMFASNPDGVVAVRLTASKKKSISGLIRLVSSHGRPISYDGIEAMFEGSFQNGLQYAAIVKVVAKGGKVNTDDNGIRLSKCNDVVIYLKASTSYVLDYTRNFLGDNPLPEMRTAMDKATKISYSKLMKRHVADYRSLYETFSLSLGDDEGDGRPFRIQWEDYKKGAVNTWLEALVCQFGRYLMISSSRKGSLPANLQGVWNDSKTPAWYSQYTTNINLEMNYWAVEAVGLSSCHDQMLTWLENIIPVQKRSKDPRLVTPIGWKAYSTMNIMGGNSGWAIHLPGPAWMLRHYWMHYAYTNDKHFLRTRAFPLLSEMADFWARRLVLNAEGKYITPDGWSPEHGPGLKEGDRTPLPGVSYDQEIVYDLFRNYLAAADTLGVHDALYTCVKGKCDSLMWPKIGRWGQLQEWMDDVDSPEDHHRHFSHLYAVYPGEQISPETTPELAKAALVSLRSRGDYSVGWSTAWRIPIYARLGQAEEAYKFVRKLNSKSLFPNLFSNYGMSSSAPFQIDANFGYVAGVAEMLLQNRNGKIFLLPALPRAWNNGSVKGIRAVGGFVFDMEWKDRKIVSLRVTSDKGGECKVVLPDNTEMKVFANKTIEVML